MRPTALWLVLPLALALSGCTSTTTERLGLAPLETVPRVELGRYLGTWYEIASFPQWFQKGCTGTTAYYALRSDGELDVVNRCHLETLEGETNVARGRARVPDPESPAKLEVSFFRPFWGDYWIIDLAKDYSYAVVGHPGRDYLWILSRTPTMDPAVYEGILERLEAKAYPLERLQKTLQLAPSGGSTPER
jgi:apolipoprotein D and lipocalin family protein